MNIANYLGHDDSFETEPIRPALFLEYALYGDLVSYCDNLFTRVSRMPEVTVWKITLDLTQAIEYIHNQLGDNKHYCHSDMKPSNVLVCRPEGMKDNGFPLIPIFKISDFGRMRAFKPSQAEGFYGTYEFAPPKPERDTADPATDIWAVAATISFAVFRTEPVEHIESFVNRWNNDRQLNPKAEVLDVHTRLENYHREIRDYLYRPLNVSKNEQVNKYQVHPAHAVEPYSNEVQHWYQRCYRLKKEDRMTAAHLRVFIPRTAVSNIHLYAVEWRRQRWEMMNEQNERRRADGQQELPADYGDLTTDYGDQDL